MGKLIQTPLNLLVLLQLLPGRLADAPLHIQAHQPNYDKSNQFSRICHQVLRGTVGGQESPDLGNQSNHCHHLYESK
jgi:hypothetical protein